MSDKNNTEVVNVDSGDGDQNEEEKLVTTKYINQEIYSVIGVDGESQVEVRHLGTQLLKEGVKINHTKSQPMELLPNVVLQANICNFVKDDILHYRKRVPILFIDVWSVDGTSMSLLFQLFLHFKFPELVSEDTFFSEKLDGKFVLEVVIDSENQQLDANFTEFPGPKDTINKMIEFLKTDAMLAYINGMIEEEKKRKKKEREDALTDLLHVPKATVNFRDEK